MWPTWGLHMLARSLQHQSVLGSTKVGDQCLHTIRCTPPLGPDAPRPRYLVSAEETPKWAGSHIQ